MNILYIVHPSEQNTATHAHTVEVIANLRKLGHTVSETAVSGSGTLATPSDRRPLWVRILRRTPAKWLYWRFYGELSLLYLTWIELKLLLPILLNPKRIHIVHASGIAHMDVIYSRHRWLNLLEIVLGQWYPYVREVNGFVADEMRVRGKGSRFSVWLFDRIERWNLKRGDRWVAVTERIKETLVQEYGVAEEKVAVVENGANTELFCPESVWKRRQKEEEASLLPEDTNQMLAPLVGLIAATAVISSAVSSLYPKREHKLCFVGQIWEHQKLEQLTQAMPLIDADLVVVGDGPKLEQLKETAPMENYPLFVGRVKQARAAGFMRYADVCVGPFMEGDYSDRIGRSALKLCEYLACGKPVVCSRAVGTEFVEEERCGVLVDDLKPETIAGAVNLLLENPEMRKEMGKRGRRYVVRERSWEKVVVKIAKVMEETCHK